ncbi:MAG TPA: HD domain-containing protein [Azonexus sp.]
MQDLVDRVAAHIKARFIEESSGHDWHHIDRVRRLSRRIAQAEGADPVIAELGALVHDIADWKFHGGDDSVGPREAEALLRREGAPDEVIAAVVDIVATISYKGAGVATPMKTLEGRCVQDADRLDAIGAIGIARCFAYGGHAGRPLHDPEQPPVLHQSAAAYKAAKGASLNHFYEKLFLLKERMNTPTGRALAEERHRFMAEYVQQFLREWEGTA